MKADVLIVGSGAAGLTAALNLAETHKVAVIAKGALGDSASARAQGGIAAVLEEGDSFEAHVNDTMIAGAGLNDRKVVEHVVEAAPRAIQRLIALGVPFASENGALHLTREGGPQPPPHRPCRRCDRLGHSTGARSRRRPGTPTSRLCPTWSRSTSSPAVTPGISRPAGRCTASTPTTARRSASKR